MQRILKPRLSTKIMIYIFVFIVLSTGVIMSYLTKVYENLIHEEVERATSQQVDVFAAMLNNHLDTVYQKLDSYAGRPAVVRLMNANYTRIGTIQDIRDSLPESCVDTGAVNMYLYVNNLNSFYAAFGTEIPDKIRLIVNGMKEDQSINTSEFRVLTDVGSNAVYCIKVVRDYQTRLFRGLIIAHISAWDLVQHIEKNQNIHGDIYGITEEGTMFYKPISPKLPCQLQSLALQDGLMQQMDSYCVYVKRLESSDLFLVGINDGYPESDLYVHFRRVFLIIAASVAGFLVLSLVLVKILLRPLSELTSEIRNTDPDNLVPLGKYYRDEETRVLADAYDELVEKVNDNIDKKYKAELALKQAQINTLQYQINPHFVNNTLQLIGSMAVEKDMLDLYEIVVAFSRIFYYSIKFKGGSFVQLRDELEFLDDYIILQQARYPDKLNYEKKVQTECCGAEVPKLIIQPLIENCFSHAFMGKEGTWMVRVEAKICDAFLTISVSDNGTGMTKEQMAALESELDDPDNTLKIGTSHIGIRNVNARLCLLYGISCRLRFLSKEGEGTTFYIRIPVSEKEEI